MRNYWDALKFFPKINGKWDFIMGRRYNARNEWGTFRCVDRFSIANLFPGWEAGVNSVIMAHKGEGLFVDVGANIGVHSVTAGKLGMEVIALEPALASFQCLKTNLTTNRIKGSALRMAAWSSSGWMTLHLSHKSSMFNSLYDTDVDGTKLTEGYHVKTVRLDELLYDQGRIPRLIKLDAEKAEEEVIKGLTLTLGKRSTTLVFEAIALGDLRDCTALLNTLGYEVKQVKNAVNLYLATPSTP